VDRGEVKQLDDALQRYAGWLDRERTYGNGPAAVHALGAAIDTGVDPCRRYKHSMPTLRLPSGAAEKCGASAR
jgi:hypothetical protein